MKKLLIITGLVVTFFAPHLYAATQATNAQIQTFVDKYVRKSCEQLRALKSSLQADKSGIDDIYYTINTSTQAFTWVDQAVKADNSNQTQLNPPHFVTKADINVANAKWDAFLALMGDGDWSALMSTCPNPPGFNR